MERKITPPVILICGPAGHGKTTAREILARVMQLKGGSCSDVVYAYLARIQGAKPEETAAKIAELRAQDKETLRPTLVKIGNWLCGDVGNLKEDTSLVYAENSEAHRDDDLYRVPSSLVRMLVHNGYGVIDGIRRKLELQHAVDHLEWNGIRVLTIYVSRPDGPRFEDNTEDLSSLCDEQVLNDGTVEDLEKKLIEILVRRFPA
jgi:hypothetical protein